MLVSFNFTQFIKYGAQGTIAEEFLKDNLRIQFIAMKEKSAHILRLSDQQRPSRGAGSHPLSRAAFSSRMASGHRVFLPVDACRLADPSLSAHLSHRCPVLGLFDDKRLLRIREFGCFHRSRPSPARKAYVGKL